MKTEEEAKKCWCPFVRLVDGSAGGGLEYMGNRRAGEGASVSPYVIAHSGCIASECMAWRWIGPDPVDPTMRTNLGFCGLAGKP